jgi:iron complex outermembrane recepter protein
MQRTGKIAALFASISLAALAMPAHAQEADDTIAIDEIIVTAQRKEQNVQDVPIAITAITGDTLTETGIRDPRDLSLLVPSLSMQAGTAASTTSLFIRGVGISDFNSNTTGAVGIYVDDVFLGANAGKLFNVFDSAGIEVLKGPQGTLYGRNTTAGAIRFSSRKPTNTFEGNVSASYGRFDEVVVEGGVGGPIIADRLKVRVSGLYNRRDGTTLNRVTGNYVNDTNVWAGRAIVDFTPSENALIRLAIHGGRNSGGARQFQHRGQGVDFFGNPAVAPDGTLLDGFGYADTDGNPYAGDYNVEGKERIGVFGASLTGEFDLGGVKLTSISAYEQVNRKTLEDTDSSPNDVIVAYYEDRPRQYSRELRLQSDDGGAFDWIIGGYYFHDTLKTDSAFDLLRSFRDPTDLLGTFDPVNSLGLVRYPYTQKTKSVALFGQANYALTERLTATAGLRYSHDRVSMDYSSFFDAVGGIAPVKDYSDIIVPLVDFQGRRSFDDLSWRLALDYNLDDTLLYASFSKGYNSGGFAGGAATDTLQLAPFDSERLFAYEAGIKTDLLDRRLRINASAFYYDYRDLQVFIFDLTGPIPLQRKVNAGNARILGFEGEVTVKPTRNLDLFAAVTLTDSKYKDFPGFSGNELVSAPPLAFSGGINLAVPLGDSGSINARVDGSYSARSFLFPDNGASGRVAGHELVNARLSWKSADETIEIALWARNLTKSAYITSVAPVITMDQVNFNDPRTFGIQINGRF